MYRIPIHTPMRRLFAGFLGAVLLLLPGCAGRQSQSFTIVCCEDAAEPVRLAVADVKSYIEAVVPHASVVVRATAEEASGHLLVVETERDEAIRPLLDAYGVEPRPTGWNAFRIQSFVRQDAPDYNIYFLSGADLLGQQYALYDWAERVLGVRYLKPDYDHIRVQPDFRAPLVNTGVEQPDFKWRGLYPWHYNYNSRGLTTFCDINARFMAQDWAWFRQLGDWMVKNKQNLFLWFDDVFAHENISGQYPDSLRAYYSMRGLKQILGMGWASNEDLTTGDDWKRVYCLNDEGRSVESQSWQRSICPMSNVYFRLADINFERMKLDRPEDYIGALIGYGENTWASNEAGVDCVHHKGVPSSRMMLRDFRYIEEKFKQAGLGHLPLGYVTSTYSVHPGTPFEVDSFLRELPGNTIFTMHTYQQSSWRQFERIYEKIAERNAERGDSLAVFHIAEVAFICGAEIPLLKPSILRRRNEHFVTLPRENTVGHLATLNTTQYLYWYNTYRIMRWQWHKESMNWEQANRESLAEIFDTASAEKLNEIFNRLLCLEHVEPYAALDSLKRTAPDLLPPPAWGRYDPKTHPDHFGFLLWAAEQNPAHLEDADRSIETILALNEELNHTAGPLYRSEFYPIVRLTSCYYAIRVAYGRYSRSLQEAGTLFAAEGWSESVARLLREAKAELERAQTALTQYNTLFLEVLHLQEPLSKDNIDDIQRDFVQNPSAEFLETKRAETEQFISSCKISL